MNPTLELIDYYQWSAERTHYDNNQHFTRDFTPECDHKFTVNDDIIVYYDQFMDGGGTTFGQEIATILTKLYPNRVFNNCFDWCSGPGFVGFNILSRGICNNLWLGDIFKPSLRAAEKSIENLPEKYKKNTIATLHLQGIEDISETLEFDLVVGNPPHWNNKGETLATRTRFRDLCSTDNDWKIHGNFFQNIKKNLSADGIILLLEQSFSSGPDTFKKIVEQNDLEITRCFWTNITSDYYYLEVRHKK